MKHSRLFRFTVAVLLAAGVLATGAAFAQQSDVHHPHFLACLKILGLSDQQKADIKAVLEAEKPVVQGLLQTLRTDHDALVALLTANPPDPCAIGNGVLKVKADRDALKAERAKILTNVEAVLTPEQKAKFEGCLQAPDAPNPTTQAAADGVDLSGSE